MKHRSDLLKEIEAAESHKRQCVRKFVLDEQEKLLRDLRNILERFYLIPRPERKVRIRARGYFYKSGIGGASTIVLSPDPRPGDYTLKNTFGANLNPMECWVTLQVLANDALMQGYGVREHWFGYGITIYW